MALDETFTKPISMQVEN